MPITTVLDEAQSLCASERAKKLAADVTHLVPPTGHARFRTSFCGVLCAEGRLEHERSTHGRGTSTKAHVNCSACLEEAFERSNRALPPELQRD